MADEETSTPSAAPATSRRSKATPRKDSTPTEGKASSAAPSTSRDEPSPKSKGKADAEVRIPKRAALPPARAAHLKLRKVIDGRRPIFGRQAANRYYRIGRDLSWRRPRGLQSKQRRHYGYRAKIVRVGYGSPGTSGDSSRAATAPSSSTTSTNSAASTRSSRRPSSPGPSGPAAASASRKRPASSASGS